jgi:hypothetical protein
MCQTLKELFMGIFSRIKEKLFGGSAEQPERTVTAGASSPSSADMAGTTTQGTGAKPAQDGGDPKLGDEVTGRIRNPAPRSRPGRSMSRPSWMPR